MLLRVDTVTGPLGLLEPAAFWLGADRITVLHQGSTLFEGTPDEVKSHPEVQEVYLTGSL